MQSKEEYQAVLAKDGPKETRRPAPLGAAIIWDPKDGHGHPARVGTVVKLARWDESSKVGALVMICERKRGPRKGTPFVVPVSSDNWNIA